MTEFPRHELPPKYPTREEAEIYTYSQWGAIRNGVQLTRVTIGTPSVSNVWGVDERHLLYRRMDTNEVEEETWSDNNVPEGEGKAMARKNGERGSHEECKDGEECLSSGVRGKRSCFAADRSLGAAKFADIAPPVLEAPDVRVLDAVGSIELSPFEEEVIATDPWASLDSSVPRREVKHETRAPKRAKEGKEKKEREVKKAWMQMTALDARSGALLRVGQVSAGENGEMWALDMEGCPYRMLKASTRQKRKLLLHFKASSRSSNSLTAAKKEEEKESEKERSEGYLFIEHIDSLMKERIRTVVFLQRIGSSGIRLRDIACGGKDCVWAIAEQGAVRKLSRQMSSSTLLAMADEKSLGSTWLFEYSRGSVALDRSSDIDDVSEAVLPHWNVRLVLNRVLTSISVSPEGDLWAVDAHCRAVQRVQFAAEADSTAPAEDTSSVLRTVGSPLFQSQDERNRLQQSSATRARFLLNQGAAADLETRLELVDDDALWQDFDVTEAALAGSDKEIVQLAVAKHIVWCATRTGHLLLKTGSSEFREVINGGQQHLVDQVMKQKEMALNETLSGFTLVQSNEYEVSKHRDPLLLMRNSKTKFLEQDFEELEALRVSQIAVNADGTVRALSKATGGFTYTLRPQKLVLSTPDMFHKLWDNRSTGSNIDIGIWRPFCSRVPEFRSLGDYIERSHLRYPSCHSFDAPPGSKPLLAMEDVDVYYSDLDADDEGFEQAVPLLMDPVNYEKLWDDSGSGAPKPCTVWRPVAPHGYRALGCVVTSERVPPTSQDQVQCVHDSVLSSGRFFRATLTKGHVWSTEDMRVAGNTCSFHMVQPLQGVGTAAQTFVTSKVRAAPAAAKAAFVFSVHPDAFTAVSP